MNEKRVLPARTNRGRRPQQSEEQKARDDAIYQELLERANVEAKESPKKENQRQKVQQRLDSAQLQLQYKLMSGNNRIFFPYSRNYHYFFDLLQFPRLQNSFSYAVDDKNVFNFTYSQEDKVIRDGLTVGQLFNRKYFGLPYCENTRSSESTKDKNICHGYLFQNEDRKFNLDRCMEELKQILKNFQKLQQTKAIHNFSCLQKDIDLVVILEDQVSTEEKKNILRKRIKILTERKENMKNFVMLQDKNFFFHSLNQKLHNSVQNKEKQLSFQYILTEMQTHDHWRQKLRECLPAQKKNTLQKLFIYYQTDNEKLCLSDEALTKMSSLLGRNFLFQDSSEEFYDITSPFTFLSFTNSNIMAVSEKVLALRLAYQNEASFYVCKLFWKKVFGRDLTINKEMKHLSRVDYEKSMTTGIAHLQKWQKQQKGTSEPIQFPHLDGLVNWQTLNENSKSFDLFPLNTSIQLNARQYICLMLYQHLYLSIAQIYQFIQANEIFYELIASQFYAKAHNYVVEAVGTVRIGILDEILKKISEWMIRADIQMNFKIKWVYNDQLKVAYVVKTSPEPEWQTEKEEEQEEEEDEQQVEDEPPSKKVK